MWLTSNLKDKLLKFIVVGIRFLLGFIFLTTSMNKLTNAQFVIISIFPMSLEAIVAPYGLGLWGRFVAWAQLVIGLLLLSQRFGTLGAIMLVPMLANIFFVTVSLEFIGTPYLVAFLLMLNLILLAAEYSKLKFIFFDRAIQVPDIPLRRENWKLDILWAVGMALCLTAGAFQSNRPLMYVLLAIGLFTFLTCSAIGIFQRRRKSETKQ